MQSAGALLRLIRPDTTILIFLSVFLPLSARTGDIRHSFAVALPMIFIAICTFILNDIDDVESDRINHPSRPLPSGRLLLPFVTAVYFVCLGLALITTKIFVQGKAAFFYYLLIIIAVNYKYVADFFPHYKSAYVACASSLPVLITVNLLQEGGLLYLLAIATFFFVLGRELLLDYMDRAGDPISFVSNMSRNTVGVLAFALQAGGLTLLLPLTQDRLDLMVLGLITILSPVAALLWWKGSKLRSTAVFMKVQMYGGLYFLFQK